MTHPTIDMAATSGFAAWLHAQGASLAFTSYRAGKLITLGCGPDGTLTASDCTLARCMGLGLGSGRLWTASAHQLWRFDNILAPGQTHDGHDAVFLPSMTILTGAVDIHDIAETSDGTPVFAVPRFNCLATPAEAHSFDIRWMPPFITEVAAEDRCHLNGLAMQDGTPRFVTCLAATNESGAWRDHKADGGVVIDVASGQTVASGLGMPHSPRLHDGQFWLNQSGTGEFGRLDLGSGAFETVARLPGLPRGLAFVGKWAVLGVSRPRHDSGFDGLPLEDRLSRQGIEPICAITAVNLETGEIDYTVEIGPDTEEIYDVCVLRGIRNPKLVDPTSDEARFFIRPSMPSTSSDRMLGWTHDCPDHYGRQDRHR
ncbi:TIGR03032 family protein [Roseisalinus antarcticus]|uniref:Conserved hypothetical protein CHP03032 domain-containing protein n=1 Tax=Roseisalinus antarcticus TaxID=254357 RepID=A0A1Y5U4D7_9RHOB|nr:TIGR03032 family protein [Roseisalinus antarcticus]SLN77971.1 hypothetical protein ROA7023_04616 [Roseisalinus antarcticus]